MKTVNAAAIRLLEKHILLNSRILERRRFDYVFRDGDAESVVTALLPYRNPDGGFGNALEPDGRGPGSQPVTVAGALSILDEVGVVDGELVQSACDYLASISADDGGVPFVHPNIADYPRAPWWAIPKTYAGHVIPTGLIAGLLHKNKVEHPWLSRATEFCWTKVESITEVGPYDILAGIKFLDHVPDRTRAEATAVRLGKLVRERRLVKLGADESALEGFAEGEHHYPHDFAPSPESLARQWFSDAELEASLDHLVLSQQDDGGWPVLWGIWTPATAYEWGAWVSLDALRILRSHGRVETAAPRSTP
jgi:hypothetical protein